MKSEFKVGDLVENKSYKVFGIVTHYPFYFATGHAKGKLASGMVEVYCFFRQEKIIADTSFLGKAKKQ